MMVLADKSKKYGYDYPKDCYLSDELLERRNAETPDFLELKRLTNIPVFLYGPEKSGGKLHKFVKHRDSIFLGDAKTATSNYVMERADWDGPVVFGTPLNSIEAKRIWGEVWLVPPEVILNLDRLNGNNELTKRDKRFVWLQEQGLDGKPNLRPALKCWMYLAETKYWEDQQTVKMASTKAGLEEVYEWKTDVQFEIPAFLTRRAY